MTLSDFYDRFQFDLPGIPEGMMRAWLVDSIHTISRELDAPRQIVTVTCDEDGEANVALDFVGRKTLTPPIEAGDAIFGIDSVDTTAYTSELNVANAPEEAEFIIVVVGEPREVPEIGASGWEDFEVPFGDTALLRILGERGPNPPLHWARYQEALQRERVESREDERHLLTPPWEYDPLRARNARLF